MFHSIFGDSTNRTRTIQFLAIIVLAYLVIFILLSLIGLLVGGTIAVINVASTSSSNSHNLKLQ